MEVPVVLSRNTKTLREDFWGELSRTDVNTSRTHKVEHGYRSPKWQFTRESRRSGVTVNARQIYEDALQDIEKIMEKFREEEDEGPIFFVG